MAKVLVVSHYAPTLVNFRGVLIRSMTEAGHKVVALGPEPGYGEALEALGARYRQYPLERTGLNPLHDYGTLRSLVRIIREESPEIVFSYAVKPVIYGSKAAGACRVPGIYSMITGLGYAFGAGDWKRMMVTALVCNMYRRSLRLNRAVFFQNPDDRDLFVRLGLLPEGAPPVLVNGSGVDLDRFYWVPPPPPPLTFLLVARLLRDKGIGEFVAAARVLKRRYPAADFQMLGPLDPNPTALRREEVENWSREGIIRYLGETRDVRPFLERAHVFVLPSYREGTPRSVLEAMAVGRPVITTAAPGCRETVRPGENGWLVPVQNVTKLVEAMDFFLQNPERILVMGQASRRIAEEKYDVRQVNQVLMRTMGLGSHDG
ncbi:MAG TPA: glycosyltransferase family 4 protein [Atribacteraceae bacterium]|nr:glycosyltransferase family 4 protein [Atribacteraceae bacterium]